MDIENFQNKRIPLKIWILLAIEGLIIGGGAILPGVSGCVLAVVFGLYRPFLMFMAHPVSAFKRYIRVFIPVGIGWALGFFIFAKLIELIFGASRTLSTWLFIGLIAGTFPSLFREARKDGLTRGYRIAFAVGFAAMFASLLFFRTEHLTAADPGIGWFFICGVLWGLSFIIPGMTTSSILMSIGLFEPMTRGLASFDPSVFLPMILGICLIVVTCSRLVNRLFERHYCVSYHATLGIVTASTIAIIPTSYSGAAQLALGILFGAAGFAGAWSMEHLGQKLDNNKE